MNIGEMKLRLSILSKAISMAQANGDERWRKLAPQRDEFKAKLLAAIKAERGTLKPEPVVVKMQTLSAVARAPKPGGG